MVQDWSLNPWQPSGVLPTIKVIYPIQLWVRIPGNRRRAYKSVCVSGRGITGYADHHRAFWHLATAFLHTRNPFVFFQISLSLSLYLFEVAADISFPSLLFSFQRWENPGLHDKFSGLLTIYPGLINLCILFLDTWSAPNKGSAGRVHKIRHMLPVRVPGNSRAAGSACRATACIL
jgi:hypothetical protein